MVYSGARMTRSYLYGIAPSAQRDLAWRNWRRMNFGKEINNERLSSANCRQYRSAWEDFLLEHEGAMEYPCRIERKRMSTFVNKYFKLTNDDEI